MAYEREQAILIDAVREAGEAIKRRFADDVHVRVKSDNSPVTDADFAANTILTERLHAAFPDDALFSEEVMPDAAVAAAPRCWVIDPLDGTASFVQHDTAFAVMVALEIGGRPVVGAVYHPMTDDLYAAVRGEGATVTRCGETTRLRFSPVPFESARLGVYPASFETLTTGIPRWADDPARWTPTDTHFGFRPVVLETTFDGYIGWIAGGLRGGGYPWDLCATDLIVHEAGGALTDVFGRQHQFHRIHERMAGGIVAARDAALHAAILGRLETGG